MSTHSVPQDSPAMRRIILALEHSDKTVDEIALVAFVARSTLAKLYMTELKKQGRVHVTRYQPPKKSGCWSPVYRAGPGKNAVRPPRQTNTESCNKYEAKTGRNRTMRQIKSQMARMPKALSFAGQFGA